MLGLHCCHSSACLQVYGIPSHSFCQKCPNQYTTQPLLVCAKLRYQAVGCDCPALRCFLEGGSVGMLPCLVNGIQMSSWTHVVMKRLRVAVSALEPMILVSASPYIRKGTMPCIETSNATQLDATTPFVMMPTF